MPLASVFKALLSPKRRTPPPHAARVAVIGAGRMGALHARTLMRAGEARLQAIVDPDANRAKKVATLYHTEALNNPADLQGQVDAVIVATPTPTHLDIALPFLKAGVSCLIEKPLASSLDEAKTLVDAAKASGAVLQVGHIERFNPAVIRAAEFINKPRFIEVSRLGPYDPRTAHIGVIMDLMIHDLDIVLFLVGEEVTRVEAFGAKVLSELEDIAKVRLHFANGCIADLSASRVSLQKYRRIRVFQAQSYLSLDYAAPSLKVYRKKTETVRSLRDVAVLSPALSKEDPLTLEQRHFLECVRDHRTPLVSGQHGLKALELARRVLDDLKMQS